ncbi:MAG: alpha-galactosidase [Acidimicrobiales bacterium]|nr:alpha-galactosidase [Acidimicrobiales bacterium]
MTFVHLRGTGADVVVDTRAGVPSIVHWGAPLGVVDPDSIGLALSRPITHGSLDVVGPLTVVPEHGSGWQGRPGLAGHRRTGAAWAPRFVADDVVEIDGGLEVTAVDPLAGLRLMTRLTLDDVLVVRSTLTNVAETRYLLDDLSITLPLPVHASELLEFTGRWTRELHPVRRDWGTGAISVENRRGRTSHEHVPLVFAGAAGFGEWQGEVWGAHLAWSGNHHWLAECLPDGRRYLQLGELLHPGEIALEPGESYDTPEVVATYAIDGLTPASWGFHRHLRRRPGHPRTPRPVLLNTWEAVYFDHDVDRLRALATAAADVGIERFVLDDGWFGSRRDDRRGLGDWVVSPVVYPDGLRPLIDHVRSLGMEFGIWVEPEMVNPDSDVFSAHPDWALSTEGYEPVLGRHQLVLDLAIPDAFDHVLGQLDALLRDHDISYVKWDMNRDHVQGSGASGAAGTHAQTLALYRLLDELQRRHPEVEIESCSSGGARIDHEILRRTRRVWTSDCNDALERQSIQRGASMFVPPEVMGAHIGPPRSHTTGRTQSLSFRAITALFGHLGVEWNVLDLDERDRGRLRDVIALHRELRPLLHSGDVVRFDPVSNGPEAVSHAHGVYAADRREAIVAVVQLRTGMSLSPPPVRMPGLLADRRYDVALIDTGDVRVGPGRSTPAWMEAPTVLTGRQLAVHGVQPPAMHPETAILLRVRAID